MLKIVDFKDDYREVLYKIHLSVLPEFDRMSERCFFDEFKQDTRKYFVALDDEDVIGYIGLINTIDDCNIIGIAVKECCQRKGVGSLLLEEAIKYVQANKIKTISLEVDESNIKAINFYKKKGFVVTNIRKKYYKDNDAYIMWLYL